MLPQYAFSYPQQQKLLSSRYGAKQYGAVVGNKANISSVQYAQNLLAKCAC